MARRSITLVAVLVVAILLLASACGPTSASPEGRNWRLSAWSVSSIDPSKVTITAQISEGRIAGNSGVNSYSGACTLGPGGAFSAGPLIATKMAGPAEAMRAESAFLILLGQARAYKVAGDTLFLYDRKGNVSLAFSSTGK